MLRWRMARYVVKEHATGKRYKGLNLAKAADKAQLDPHEIEWATSEEGRADTDTHTVKRQSGGKPGFAFR